VNPDERLLQLTQREVELLLRYAYPFEAEAGKLRASKPRKGWYDVQIGAFWLSQWIGDLSYFISNVRSVGLREELDALCCVLQNAERGYAARGADGDA
jgi:hypothetical protein